MKNKYLLSVLFVTMFAGQVWAQRFQSGDLWYNVTSNSTVEVTYYQYYDYSHKISYNYNLTIAVIPEKVTHNGVEYVVTTIGYRAFSGCRDLRIITIPESITNICDFAFAYDYDTHLYFAASEQSDKWSPLWNYSENWSSGGMTTHWNIKNPIIENDYIFNIISEEENKEVEILRYIGDSIHIAVPSIVVLNDIEYNVTQIKEDAFLGYDNLDYNTYDNAYYVGNPEKPYLALMSAKSKNITSCKISNQCIFINKDAFSNCSSLTEITIPATIASIGEGAFYGCNNLRKADFASIEDLCKIKFGREGEYFDIYANPLYYTQHLYINGDEITELVIPDGVTSIGAYAFCGCFGLRSVSIPESVTRIGKYAFYQCPYLEKTEFASIENLCKMTFAGESANPLTNNHPWPDIDNDLYVNGEKITDLVIPDGVSSIGDYTFFGCKLKSKSITIPNSVINIGNYAFYGCKGFISIVIPESVTNIGNCAFVSCPQLKMVVIGSNIVNINKNTFQDCNNLRNIVCTASEPPTLTEDLFPTVDVVYVPRISVDAYQKATIWKRKEIKPFYNITATSADETAGTIMGDNFQLGDSFATISATPSVGYHFTHWSDGNTDAKRELNIANDTSITAYFAIDTFDINVWVDNIIFGSVSGTARYTYGSEATIVATPSANYHFLGWSNGISDSLYTFIVDKSLTITAYFEGDIRNIKLNAENGIVTSNVSVYRYGEKATLTATAKDGYSFVKWSDGNTDNPRTITVFEDLSLTAVFEADATFITQNTAIAVNIYTYDNKIVVENATEEIFVYNAMGALVGRGSAHNICTININTTGVYIVKTGATVKRVMVK